MFKISDFSQLTGVTVRALRHYDRLGLLKPARVDAVSGYRYYSADQLPRLNRIVVLKDLGFTLAHIAGLLNETLTSERLRELLEPKQRALEAEVEEKQAFLERVVARLQEIEGEGSALQYTVTLKHLEPQRVASVREVATAYTIGALYRKVFSHLENLGVEPSGPTLAITYETFADHSFDVDAAVPLEQNLSGSEDRAVRVWTLPEVRQGACTVHRGYYPDIKHAYKALLHWLEENGYQKAGPIRTVYLELGARTMTHGPEVTELQLPVTRAT